MPEQLEVIEVTCRQCDSNLPARAPGPGRPRVFCSPRCSMVWHQFVKMARLNAVQAERMERRRYEDDRRFFGKREADRRAKDRKKNRGTA